jgi:phosphogluconate dehydratase
MNPTLLRVTQRIIERSKETRSAYLARIEQAKSNTVHRSQLACGNLATALPPASLMIKPR